MNLYRITERDIEGRARDYRAHAESLEQALEIGRDNCEQRLELFEVCGVREENPIPGGDDQSFSIRLTESEAILIIAQLLHLERAQIMLADTAKAEGNNRHEKARRASATKALALATRLEEATRG